MFFDDRSGVCKAEAAYSQRNHIKAGAKWEDVTMVACGTGLAQGRVVPVGVAGAGVFTASGVGLGRLPGPGDLVRILRGDQPQGVSAIPFKTVVNLTNTGT